MIRLGLFVEVVQTRTSSPNLFFFVCYKKRKTERLFETKQKKATLSDNTKQTKAKKKKKQESLSEQHNHGKTKKRQAQSSKHRKKKLFPSFQKLPKWHFFFNQVVSVPSFSVAENRKLTCFCFFFQKEEAKKFSCGVITIFFVFFFP